jgi:sugar phosphate isomerase/epimerase
MVDNSVQLYSVRSSLADDLAGTIARIAGVGFTNVEPFDIASHADELRVALAAHDLTAPSAHAALLDDDPAKIFDAAETLGVGTVIVPFVSPDHWQSAGDVRAVAERLNDAARRADQRGMRVGYHNHGFELASRIDGRHALEVLADYLDPAVVLEIDTYWAAVGGADPADLLRRLSDRVRFIHIKDGLVTEDNKDQLPVGSGKMPIDDILAVAPGVEANVVELDDYRGDIFEALRQSFAYLDSRAATAGSQR